MGVGIKCQVPAAFHWGKIWYPVNRRLGESQGLSGQVLNISPTLPFDPGTIQGEVSLTDKTINKYVCVKKILKETHSKCPIILAMEKQSKQLSTADNTTIWKYQTNILH